ncbi:MAG: DUF2231 domain-containing protein [Bdellovibrionota bacterium]
MQISEFLGSLHPRLIPFPIALILASLFFDVFGLMKRNEKACWSGRILMLAGTVTLLFAFICGILAEIWAGRAGVPHHQIKFHELAATGASWALLVLASWRLFLGLDKPKLFSIYLIAGAAMYGLLAVAGYLGGELMTEYGAAVTGAKANTVLSLHDLNTLAQRQTDLNLEYSDMMHRIFGWMVVALSLTLLVSAISPKIGQKLQWVGPSLLILGGAFLFFFADLDLYEITDMRQFYDREVQMHKLLSVIMSGFGFYALRRQSNAGNVPARSRRPEERHEFQSKLIAVLALIGGGMLFTHVHTVAPYANVAAGVYLNHIALGVVALCIGLVRLAQAPAVRLGKLASLLFPALMLLEGFLLATYTEGLPWWIGYGHYNRWGPHGGNIAPYGDLRAELVFDPQTGSMDVHVLERFKDSAVRIPTRQVEVLVSQGYQKAVVNLYSKDENPEGASHFRGGAEFLKKAVSFSARAELPIDGRMRLGYFEPWVTPNIVGIPPNQVAKYSCPMHEGYRAVEAGACRLCGMELTPIRENRSYQMHDQKFQMALAVNPKTISARSYNEFVFTPKLNGGGVVNDIAVVHEHPMHLIVVSDDLRFFDHVHPERQANGSFKIDYWFPKGGKFIFFADITPQGEGSQVFRIPVTVEEIRTPASINEGGEEPSSSRISQAGGREFLAQSSGLTLLPRQRPSDAWTRKSNAPYLSRLILQPRKLVSERHAHLAFELSQNGKPVTDLKPYIGALGHCVIISEDTQVFLHSHPEMFSGQPSKDERGGPLVAFHTEFPRPGRYKVWGQFLRGDDLIVADYVVEVKKPLLPKGLVDFLIFD